MRKYLKITILFGFISANAFSQTTTSDKTNIQDQRTKIEEITAAINKQFTKVTTGTAFSNLGNFASFSSDSKSFSIGGNKITSDQSIWGIELSGGATEGIFKLFNNEELNSNFSGELKYHKLTRTYMGSRDAFEIAEIDQQINDLRYQFSKDSLALSQRKDLYRLQSELINSNLKISELTKQIRQVDSLLKIDAEAPETKNQLKAKKGLLEFEKENEKFNISVSTRQLNAISNNPENYFEEELEKKSQIKDKKWRDLKKKKQDVELQGFDFKWISFGLRTKNNEFKLFEPTGLPKLQFKDTSFVSQRLSASISRYRSTSYQSQDAYWSAGFYMDYTTNFNSLKKVEIEERTPIPGNPLQEIKRTIIAYQGSYDEEIFEFTFFYDYYRFFGQFRSIIGIHLNPSMSYSNVTKKPLSNVSLGVIVPFLDKEKQTSKANVEIFYNRQDIFDYLNKATKSSFWGIRGTLPITIINYKQ